jgi:hypothetical protein
MPNPIRSILAAAGLLMVAALAAAGFLVVAGAPAAHAACQITGPSTAIVNQSFTLCGPSTSNSTFEWYGPGISASTYSRCVDVDGLARGAYEFTLIRRVNNVEVERCTRVVNVGGSTGGVESCNISGPETINDGQTATLCAPQDGIHTYSWSGPNGVISSSACITVSDEGVYTLTSRNRFTDSVRNCSHRLTVIGYGGGGGSSGDCDISGPTTIPVGAAVQLCGPNYANLSYRWTGPNGFVSTSRCVSAGDGGTYYLTTRDTRTGRTMRCSQLLTEVSGGGGYPGGNDCDISGPTTIPAGSTVQLCAPNYGNTTYRWTGPDGYVSTSRCIGVDAGGTYYLIMRNRNTGSTTRCSQSMTVIDQGGNGGYPDDNPDNPVSDNCPRGFQYWRTAFNGPRYGNGAALSRGELNNIARAVDARSTYFNWSNDVDGLRQALSPATPLTRRKQVIRQFAALLSNVAAAQANVTDTDGSSIGLALDTPVSFGGARTVGELIALTDRLLAGNRGDFAKLNATLNLLNRGPCD